MIKPKAKVAVQVKKLEVKKPSVVKIKPQVKTPVKAAVKPVVKAPSPKPVAKPVAKPAPKPVPAPEPVEAAPAKAAEVETAPATEPVAAPVPKTHEKSHSHDVEKIQQQADVNTDPQADIPTEKPEEAKVPEVSANKQRSIQYEKDLNSARDQIIKAQKEMKSIDSEV